jgi:hypothetical protein
MILMRQEEGNRFTNWVRTLLYFDWNLPPRMELKDPMGVEQCWVRFAGRKMSKEDIEMFIGLASIAGGSLTKELTESLTGTGIPPQRLLDMLRHALTIEARIYVRKLMKKEGEIRIGFGLEGYVDRIKELVHTGAISWADAGISERMLDSQLRMHRAYTVEYERRSREYDKRQTEIKQITSS